jgi:hypothetical protein
VHFVENTRTWEVGPPDVGDVASVRAKYGLEVTRPAAFAVERRRGWEETADSPQRQSGDMWDERRAHDLRMQKARPGSGGATCLVVSGYYAAFRSAPPGEPRAVRYEITEQHRAVPLGDVQWADWAADGRLLVATTGGRLQIRDYSPAGLVVRSEADLAHLRPNPQPPPADAYRW